MTNKAKAWLIVGIILVFVGSIFFVGVMVVSKWDFKKLSTVKYVTNTYEITDDFNNMLFDTDTADIEFILSQNGKLTVECYEYKNVTHSVKVSDSTLTVKGTDTRKWYEHIGIYTGTPKIKVYLPKTEYSALQVIATTGDVKVPKDLKFSNVEISITTGDIKYYASADEKISLKTTTGDIRLENVTAPQITLNLTTGDSYIANIKCDSLVSKGTTGDIALKNVLADKKISVTYSTGDISLDGCDAGELYLKTTTGDIKGSLLSDKVFVASSTTGDISLPQTTTGGKCEIKVTTGDVRIEIK